MGKIVCEESDEEGQKAKNTGRMETEKPAVAQKHSKKIAKHRKNRSAEEIGHNEPSESDNETDKAGERRAEKHASPEKMKQLLERVRNRLGAKGKISKRNLKHIKKIERSNRYKIAAEVLNLTETKDIEMDDLAEPLNEIEKVNAEEEKIQQKKKYRGVMSSKKAKVGENN